MTVFSRKMAGLNVVGSRKPWLAGFDTSNRITRKIAMLATAMMSMLSLSIVVRNRCTASDADIGMIVDG